MKVFLSQQCESLTGSLGKGFGYCIESRRKKDGTLYFYSKRNAKGKVPPDGHWRFIVACAEIAKNKLHITDIKLDWTELLSALYEAHHFIASEQVRRNYYEKAKADYNAADIINLKTTFSL